MKAALRLFENGVEGFEFGLQAFIEGLKAKLASRAKLNPAIRRTR